MCAKPTNMQLSENDCLKDTFVNCLTEQLSEFEVLKSMYPDKEDIILTDKKILENINMFIENKVEFTPPHLDFILNLMVYLYKVEVCIHLPSLYPNEEPEIFIRCNNLNHVEEGKLNQQLTSYIRDIARGEVCLYTAISWIQENFESFITPEQPKLNTTKNILPEDEKFVRYWIHSHHIYDKKKIDVIFSKAKELALTGFCLLGKPGIICIEGVESNCKEWWKDIKNLTWKKIVIRQEKTFKVEERKLEQRFHQFEELCFPKTASRTSKHSDMAGFSKYIEKYNLSHEYNNFFGLCND